MPFDFATDRFARPENYVHASFVTCRGAKIRYGYIPAENERAVAVHLGGQTQFLEMDYENARDLSACGVTTYFVERHGDGGSTRYSDHPQKPPALPHEVHVEDLLQFVKQEITIPRQKKLLLFGHCLGGLIALRTIQEADELFDHAILTAPMFGTHFHALGRDFRIWASQTITASDRDRYFGKARDWTWEDAQGWLAKDQTTHDDNRRALHFLWRKARPDLRVGGYTYGNIIQNCRSLLRAIDPEELGKVQTPVTILSADVDVVNKVANHAIVAGRLKEGRHVIIPGSWHGLWREADHWRDQLFSQIQDIVGQVCHRPITRRQASVLTDRGYVKAYG